MKSNQLKFINMKTKIHYRVVTPFTFSDINSLPGGKPITTIEEAKKALDDWGSVPETSEHFEYWNRMHS